LVEESLQKEKFVAAASKGLWKRKQVYDGLDSQAHWKDSQKGGHGIAEVLHQLLKATMAAAC